MGSNGTNKKEIQSTQTAFDIIEIIAESDRPSISEIAAAVDHSRSTVHYHLNTLQRNRYVVRDENGVRLGLRMARLGDLSLRHHRLGGVVEKTVDDLASETDAVAHVAVKERNKLVWLYRSSAGSIEDLPTDIGRETPMHCTAYGQAILAYMPTEAVDDLAADSGLPAMTEWTITDPDSLDDRLATIRKLGFAYSAQEFQTGVSSIAAPIFDDTDAAVGAIGLTDADSRIDNPYKHAKARRFSDELPGHVRKAARIASDHVPNT